MNIHISEANSFEISIVHQLMRTEVRLEVRLSIPQNVTFYSRLGNEVLGKHDYPNATDQWYVMRKVVATKRRDEFYD